MAKTIKTKEISIWIWNEKNRKVFNPLKCRLTQVKVKATFERFIYEKYYKTVEVSFKHPILGKKLKTIIPSHKWNCSVEE